jgi:hypothetical protein
MGCGLRAKHEYKMASKAIDRIIAKKKMPPRLPLRTLKPRKSWLINSLIVIKPSRLWPPENPGGHLA